MTVELNLYELSMIEVIMIDEIKRLSIVRNADDNTFSEDRLSNIIRIETIIRKIEKCKIS